MIIAYPASLFRNIRVDEFFENEYKQTSNVFDTILIDQETFCITKNKELVDGEIVLYRGWIITQEQYDCINHEVQRLGGKLAVSPEE